MNHYVIVNQNAATEMLMAGLEAYTNGRLGPSRGRSKWTETFGHLWGYRKIDSLGMVHVVDHVSISVLAERKRFEVKPDPEVQRLKAAIARHMRPEWTLLGDIHTHPYASDTVVRTNKGWHYSQQDEDHAVGDNDLWRFTGRMPLMLVLSICRIQRVRASLAWDQTHPQPNVVCCNMGEYRFHLAAYVGEEIDGKRKFSERTRSAVTLARLPMEMYQFSGSRLGDDLEPDEVGADNVLGL